MDKIVDEDCLIFIIILCEREKIRFLGVYSLKNKLVRVNV